jgi:hypothetical protein
VLVVVGVVVVVGVDVVVTLVVGCATSGSAVIVSVVVGVVV